jgi:hypothetical protein
LVKDPTQRCVRMDLLGSLLDGSFSRPTAQQLLQSPFFKGPIRKNHLVSTILSQYIDPRLIIFPGIDVLCVENLPPLVSRQERSKC